MRSSMATKFDAPHQPDEKFSNRQYIELNNDERFRHAVKDLEGFERIWIIWWFHRNDNWRPMVRPPRGKAKRRGVFATRAPYRPNPIGITATTLLSVEKNKIFVGAVDLIDDTPILDIKPYLPESDSFPGSKVGWLEEVDEFFSRPPAFVVTINGVAHEKLSWLRINFNIDFLERAQGILERDPTPHRTRRIVRLNDSLYRMGCGAWRLFFMIEGSNVIIIDVDRGYPEELLTKDSYGGIPDKEAQILFYTVFNRVVASGN